MFSSMAATAQAPLAPEDGIMRGATVATLAPGMARSLHLPEATKGAVVVNGRKNDAFGLNVVSGDVIVTADGKRVETAEALYAALASHRRGSVRLVVLRSGRALQVPVIR